MPSWEEPLLVAWEWLRTSQEKLENDATTTDYRPVKEDGWTCEYTLETILTLNKSSDHEGLSSSLIKGPSSFCSPSTKKRNVSVGKMA